MSFSCHSCVAIVPESSFIHMNALALRANVPCPETQIPVDMVSKVVLNSKVSK